jgi:hypothetical protein
MEENFRNAKRRLGDPFMEQNSRKQKEDLEEIRR